jgi:hypothetical protein
MSIPLSLATALNRFPLTSINVRETGKGKTGTIKDVFAL